MTTPLLVHSMGCATFIILEKSPDKIFVQPRTALSRTGFSLFSFEFLREHAKFKPRQAEAYPNGIVKSSNLFNDANR
jgi:hypothetical protein